VQVSLQVARMSVQTDLAADLAAFTASRHESRLKLQHPGHSVGQATRAASHAAWQATGSLDVVHPALQSTWAVAQIATHAPESASQVTRQASRSSSQKANSTFRTAFATCVQALRIWLQALAQV
jgi:hypothetical protein